MVISSEGLSVEMWRAFPFKSPSLWSKHPPAGAETLTSKENSGRKLFLKTRTLNTQPSISSATVIDQKLCWPPGDILPTSQAFCFHWNWNSYCSLKVLWFHFFHLVLFCLAFLPGFWEPWLHSHDICTSDAALTLYSYCWWHQIFSK